MQKYTPGPWAMMRMLIPPKEKDRRCGFVVNSESVKDEGDLDRRVCDLRAPCGLGGFSEAQANARLIAAAPELLAALRFALNQLELLAPLGSAERRLAVPCIRQAESAIRKAELGD